MEWGLTRTATRTGPTDRTGTEPDRTGPDRTDPEPNGNRTRRRTTEPTDGPDRHGTDERPKNRTDDQTDHAEITPGPGGRQNLPEKPLKRFSGQKPPY